MRDIENRNSTANLAIAVFNFSVGTNYVGNDDYYLHISNTRIGKNDESATGELIFTRKEGGKKGTAVM